MATQQENFSPARERLHEIIFEADTPAGKFFDIILMIFIILSVIVVMLETVPSYQAKYGQLFTFLEFVFTIFFSIEYILRLYCVHKPMKYATSFFGIIDLLSIIPFFIALVVTGTQSLVVIRALRLMRVFRVFKLANFMTQGQLIITALKASRAKIFVFMTFILLLVSIMGSVMYLVEGGANNGFDSIPRSVYWAIVTLTTVGYGDISPITPLGQFIAAAIMILGYAIIAVPTGIVAAEINQEVQKGRNGELLTPTTQTCRYCMEEGHASDATFCKYCGERLNPA